MGKYPVSMKKKGMLFLYLAIFILMGSAAYLYLFFEDDLIKTLALIMLIIAIILAAVFFYLEFTHPGKKLRKKLALVESKLAQESLDFLKAEYINIYKLYLSLPDKKKANFYARVIKLREQIEQQLKSGHQLEFLLKKAELATVEELKPMYQEIETVFQSLTTKLQQEHYPKLSYLKDKLEQGK